MPKITSVWWKLFLTLFDTQLLQSKILFSSTQNCKFSSLQKLQKQNCKYSVPLKPSLHDELSFSSSNCCLEPSPFSIYLSCLLNSSFSRSSINSFSSSPWNIYIYIYIYITNKNLNIYNNSHKKHNFISSHFFKSRATHISHYTNYRTALYT